MNENLHPVFKKIVNGIIGETGEKKEQTLEDLIDSHFGVNDEGGSYVYHLTRAKEAFHVGTMTFDDFQEITCDDEWLGELKKAILEWHNKQITT